MAWAHTQTGVLELPAPERQPLSRDVWRIAFSAFFADLGYQTVVTGLPIFLVLSLGAPVWLYGVASAIAYGPGAFVTYVGGRVSDRVGRKRIAVLGNLLIPLLAFTGLATSAAAAIALFCGGMWARNFRRGPRRAIISEVTPPEQRTRAFALLSALDEAGGMVAAAIVVGLLALRIPLGHIFLFAVLPLLASTAFLASVRAGGKQAADHTVNKPIVPGTDLRLYRGIMIAACLFGFSAYSVGFPILTVAQGTHSDALGVLTYIVFQGAMVLSSLAIGTSKRAGAGTLGLLGYIVAAAASLGLAVAYSLHADAFGFYAAAAALGLAMGVVETLEPTVISRVTPPSTAGGGMGSLAAARSFGLLIGNLSMSLLYQVGPQYSYAYAALGAVAAALVVLVWSRSRPATPATPAAASM